MPANNSFEDSILIIAFFQMYCQEVKGAGQMEGTQHHRAKKLPNSK